MALSQLDTLLPLGFALKGPALALSTLDCWSSQHNTLQIFTENALDPTRDGLKPLGEIAPNWTTHLRGLAMELSTLLVKYTPQFVVFVTIWTLYDWMVLLKDSVLEVIENCEDYHCTTLNNIRTSQKCGGFFLEITDLFDSKQCCRFNHACGLVAFSSLLCHPP